jgi:soluble lytic murein transglycosylase-like protein
VLLYSAGAVTEIPASLVSGFEADEVVAPPPAAPAAPEPAAAPAPAADNSPEHLAEQAARKFALPESFIRSVMRAESGFQPAAISPKGAIGLMQLMPDTARYLGVDARDPQQNAEGGARYLRELLERYQNEPDQVYRALAAYNAGPAAVEKYHGVPPYQETREYILRVLKNWDQASTTGDSGNNAPKLSY